MKKIAIMTDSNCGIMPDMGSQYGIHILPMPVIIDGETYHEGIDLTSEEFYEKQKNGASITTSQPSPAEVTEMWDRLLKDHDEVLCIPMSSGLSNTCQTAHFLSSEKNYKGKVFVVDNRRISVTQAVTALQARTLAEEGKRAEEIKDILENQADDFVIYIAVDTLEYLKKGGRITPAAAALGSVLRLKPVLTIRGSKLDSFAKARGMKSAFRIMTEALGSDINSQFSHLRDSKNLKIGIANTMMDEDKLESFKTELKNTFPEYELIYFPLTMSIGTHIGPGGLGVAVFRDV